MTRKPRRATDLGIDDDLYDALLASQDGHCALCPTRPKTRRLHVDHDHRSPDNRVRGLLCHHCNRNLPAWVTPEWCLHASSYLRDPHLYFSLMRNAKQWEAARAKLLAWAETLPE